jgi:hypothetical protein
MTLMGSDPAVNLCLGEKACSHSFHRHLFYFQDCVMAGLENKNPKVVVGCVQCLREALRYVFLCNNDGILLWSAELGVLCECRGLRWW